MPACVGDRVEKFMQNVNLTYALKEFKWGLNRK